jgi:hypothetical protein
MPIAFVISDLKLKKTILLELSKIIWYTFYDKEILLTFAVLPQIVVTTSLIAIEVRMQYSF